MNRIEFINCSLSNDICSTCLSPDRRLFKVKHLSHFLDINTAIFACWECKALLTNFHKFKTRALKAQEILRNCHVGQIIPSLSNLTTELSLTYEVGFQHDTCEKSNSKILIPEDYGMKIDIKEEIKLEQIDYEEIIPVFLENENSVENDNNVESDNNVENENSVENDNNVDNENNVEIINDVQNNENYVVILLSQEEMVRLRKEKLNSERFKRCRFKCELCLLGYYNELQYRDHIVKHTYVKGDFVCNICKLHFSDKSAVDVHCQSHYRLYKCKLCDFSNFQVNRIFQHYFDKHDKEGSLECSECDQLFSSYGTLKYHRATHRDVKCNECGKEFRTSTGLRSHMFQHTGIPLVECKICKKRYKGEWGLKAHMRTHEPLIATENAYCDECKIQFRSVYSYRNHIKTSLKHVTEDVYKHICVYCSKRFAAKACLKRHCEAIHIKETKYACRDCNKCYTTATSLRKHVRVLHEGKTQEKNKICDYCKKAFSSKAEVLNHINTHTGNRPFQCKLCPSNFGHKAALYTHNKLVHLKLKQKQTKKLN